MKQVYVAIVLGSASDLKTVRESKLLSILEAVSPEYDLSVISAHRNPQELEEYCQNAFNNGALVFIGVAGMSAALPGAIAANLGKHRMVRPIIGVPLPSEEYPDAQDALLSMLRMPPGMPVAVCGVGKSGLHNAALLACQIVAMTDSDVLGRLDEYVKMNSKPVQLGLKYPGGEG